MSYAQGAYEYSVKIVNQRKKSEFVVVKLKSKERFDDLDNLKKKVAEECNGQVEDPVKQIGYIEPGHGLRGKLRWLSSNDDLCDMYELFQGKKELILWTYAASEPVIGKKNTRPRSDDSSDDKVKKKSRYEGHVDKMAEVDEIHDILREKHETEYTDEQLRSWAHLIQMKKHSSLEKAPDKPFWQHSKKIKTPSSVSPGKRINLRGQCVDQLQKWHDLLDSGAITKDQYDEFKSTILEDIKKF